VPEFRSQAAKGVMSTIEMIDGPSIHVNTARQMKKEMIDHVRAVSMMQENTNVTNQTYVDISTNPKHLTR